jgi:hypothetical protein
VASASPNAAVIYWQAFAALPPLEGEQQSKYEAAIKSSTQPVTEDLQPIVARFDTSLRELHRARGVAMCDWNLNYDDGPQLLLPHLQKVRDVSQAALLRARLRFAAKVPDEAVADVIAVLKMARDCASSPVLISLLVGRSIENKAMELLTANLASLSPQQLDSLSASLKTLPATSSLADCMRIEGQFIGDWVERFIDAEAAKLNDPNAGGKILDALLKQCGSLTPANKADAAGQRKLLESLTVADVRESLRLMRADYAQLAKIAGLRPAERRGHWTELEAALAETRKFAKPTGVLSLALLPAVAAVSDREERFNVHWSLFTFAIQVQRNGPDAIKDATVPDYGQVEYRKTDAGFELRCQPGSADTPEVLKVRTAK